VVTKVVEDIVPGDNPDEHAAPVFDGNKVLFNHQISHIFHIGFYTNRAMDKPPFDVSHRELRYILPIVLHQQTKEVPFADGANVVALPVNQGDGCKLRCHHIVKSLLNRAVVVEIGDICFGLQKKGNVHNVAPPFSRFLLFYCTPEKEYGQQIFGSIDSLFTNGFVFLIQVAGRKFMPGLDQISFNC